VEREWVDAAAMTSFDKSAHTYKLRIESRRVSGSLLLFFFSAAAL
jgi:hypothetical protein